MHSNIKTGVLLLLLALTGMPIAAEETAAFGPALEGEALARAAAKRIDVSSAGERSAQAGEVLVSLPSDLSLAAIEALARRHRLTRLESQSVELLGKTVHHWAITDGRSISNVILALERDGGIDAQPNNIYILQ